MSALILTACQTNLNIPQTIKLYEPHQTILAAEIPSFSENMLPIPAQTPLYKYNIDGIEAYCAEVFLSNMKTTPCWKFEGMYLTSYFYGGELHPKVPIKFISSK